MSFRIPAQTKTHLLKHTNTFKDKGRAGNVVRINSENSSRINQQEMAFFFPFSIPELMFNAG